MKKHLIISLVLTIQITSLFAQVAINSDQTLPDASAMLDVKSTTKGFLCPRMKYSEMNSLLSPAAGLLVFCTTTNQFYFNKGTPSTPNWVINLYLPYTGSFNTSSTLFELKNTGSGSVASFNISSANNSAPVILVSTTGIGNALYGETNGSTVFYANKKEGTNNEAIRPTNNVPGGCGIVSEVINPANNWPALQVSTSGMGYAGKFNVMNTSNYSSAITAQTISGNAVDAYNASSTHATIWAQNDGSTAAIGAKASGGNGFYAENSSPDSYTVWAQNNSNGPVLGLSTAKGNAVYAENLSDSMSTIYAKNFSSNGLNAIYAENSGLYPTITAINTMTSGDRSAGYFGSGSAYAWVGCNFSGTSYKITGTGTVATIVESPSGERVSMFCPETPEILLSDFGTGKLIKGKCHIKFDPIFSHNVISDDIHPMKIFIQVEGECNGVYVTNKTLTGFDVI